MSTKALEDMYETVNAGAALERERLLKLKAEVEKCCPPPVSKPPCNYAPCPTPPKLEEPKHGGNTIPITEQPKVAGASPGMVMPG